LTCAKLRVTGSEGHADLLDRVDEPVYLPELRLVRPVAAVGAELVVEVVLDAPCGGWTGSIRSPPEVRSGRPVLSR
jgi:hypothetical protein